MVHRTNTMERVKLLRAEARQAERNLKAARILSQSGHDIKCLLNTLELSRDDALAEATALKDSGQARLEDLSVYVVEKITGKKGNKHRYWHASWKHGKESHSIYIGSCKKMNQAEALEKARKMKAEDLQSICDP
jgi:hypothetical protein